MAEPTGLHIDLTPSPPATGELLTPLCVDLDGTLISSDVLWESLLLLARHRPLELARAPFWLLAGKAGFKERLADIVQPEAGTLPYRPDVVEFLREQQNQGRQVVLATASNRRVAEAVAKHLGLFEAVVASDERQNLSGDKKLEELRRRFGAAGFDYIGNSGSDVCLLAAARRAYVAAPSRALRRQIPGVCQPVRVFGESQGVGRPLLKALRPHQWVKNLLLLAPLVLAHAVGDRHRLLTGLVAFVAFSLCASAVYVLNDLLDLESDRRHASKRRRPFASGAVSIPAGLVLFAGLLAVGFGLALHFTPARFVFVLIFYLLTTSAYSFVLKRKLLIDVIVLAGLYTLRIVAGALAIEVPLTMWLLAFSMFLFLSLAFVKRYAELLEVDLRGHHNIHGRGYRVDDLRIIESVGPASGYIAIMVFCMYLDSDVVKRLYPHGTVLWLICPILLYWVSRLWFFARRRQLHEDPIIFALRDRASLLAGVVVLLIVVLASTRGRWPI